MFFNIPTGSRVVGTSAAGILRHIEVKVAISLLDVPSSGVLVCSAEDCQCTAGGRYMPLSMVA